MHSCTIPDLVLLITLCLFSSPQQVGEHYLKVTVAGQGRGGRGGHGGRIQRGGNDDVIV